MSKKKTREEKIRLSNKPGHGIVYSYKNTPSDAIVLTNKEIDYHKKEVKIILIAASVIFSLNIVLFLLLSSNTVSLGFLGY